MQELISKPRNFIEMSVALEERLTVSHLVVLRDIRAAQIELEQIAKVSQSTYGLALWLTALSDYAHHVGLERQIRNYVPPAISKGKRDAAGKQIWQYSTNVIDLNEEHLLRTSKWSHQDPTQASNSKLKPAGTRRIR